jgi:transposase
VVETGRRRRWSEEEKARIVLESLSEPRLVAATARRYGLSRSLLVTWRRDRAHRRHAAKPTARVVAVELDASRVRALRSGGVVMHVNKVYSVATIDRVAKDLGEDEDWLSDAPMEWIPRTA